MSATLSVSTALMVFNAVQNATSPTETLTLTNIGDATLSLTGASIVADPAQTNGSAQFALANSLPSTLAVGATFALQVKYTASLVGIQYALLDIASSDPATPTAAVQLHGIGTAGLGGTNQPSLMRILHAYDMPNYAQIGETDETNALYPEPPATPNQNVDLQQMVKAGPGPVTFNVLASFVGNATTPLHIGWYQPSNVAGTKVELFHTVQSQYQSVYVQPVGNTSFDPGSDVFGLYNPSQTVHDANGNLVTGYTQDALNTYDTTDPRKFRFFPLENADGSVVPNSYIMTSTEWPSPIGYDFVNIVAIISNVAPADPVATADTASTTARTPVTVPLLSNDTATTGSLTPSSVTITTAPASGGTVTVNPTTGQATYITPAGFHGTDTFAYTVANSAGYTSAPATVTVSVSAGPGGIVTAPVTTSAIANVATTVNVLSVDSDTAGTLVPSTVTIVTAPTAGGTATVNADGTIAYTPPAKFTGTETFSYTVQDSFGATSNVTTVTADVTVGPGGIQTYPTTVDATSGVGTTVDVLANATDISGNLLPNTLAIVAPPSAGGTATVNADGTVTYTPAATFVGTETFSYTVRDTAGATSDPAVVTATVTNPPTTPVASTGTFTTTANTPVTINIVPLVTSPAALNLATLAVSSASEGSTATANADGTVTFIPTAGLVGTQQFAYTVADVNGVVSNFGTVVVDVGVRLGSAAGDARSLSFSQTGAAGGAAVGKVTMTLTHGSAVVYMGATGRVDQTLSLSVDKAGRATIGGATAVIENVALSDTTAASTLSITSPARGSVGFTSITDAAPLGRLIANTTTVDTLSLNGVGTLQLAGLGATGLPDSVSTIGSGVASVASLSLGSVVDANLSVAVPVKALKASSWYSLGRAAITAPSIGTLTVTGAFQPTLTLTAGGTSLKTATITGPLADTSPWSIAGSIGTLTVKGDLDATITAAAIQAIHATGAITDTSLTTSGNVGTITAASLSGDTFLIGTTAGTPFAAVTTATLGNATLASVKLTAPKKATAFADTVILAHTITTATLGTIDTDNSGTVEGLALASSKSITGTADGSAIHKKSLTAETFGDFQIRPVTA
jgi:hypothetical protein